MRKLATSREETGLKIRGEELVDLTKLALKDSRAKDSLEKCHVFKSWRVRRIHTHLSGGGG